MSKPRVFVTRIIPAGGLDRIRAFCDAEIWPESLPPSHEILREKAAECEGLLTMLTDCVDGRLMDDSPRLKVVSNYAVGYNNIDVHSATERGISVGNTPEVLTDATADMAFCLMIAAARRLVEANRDLLSGRWRTWEPLGHLGQELSGRTLGIVGMGRIGTALSRRCRGGWNMRVLYTDVKRRERAEEELGAQRVDFDEMLRQSDFVSVHTTLNDETRGMFDAVAFRKMKRTAVFVNTARGPIHVHEDLYRALRDGVIFAAGLDVTDPEPLPIDDPLLALPNIVIAPHIASATVTSRNAMAEIAAENLLAGLAGRPLRAWVNPEVEGHRRV
jgi:glyoxylate reductase